jgi:hypothetical protein
VETLTGISHAKVDVGHYYVQVMLVSDGNYYVPTAEGEQFVEYMGQRVACMSLPNWNTHMFGMAINHSDPAALEFLRQAQEIATNNLCNDAFGW